MAVSAWMPRGVALALGSALLFGASTPLAKLALRVVDPGLLAGLLYLGSGIGLALWKALQLATHQIVADAPIRRRDLPLLTAVVLCGGVAAPTLLMLGLLRTPASSASLLLNLEGLATLLIAWLVVREQVDRRLVIGAAAMLSGAVLLSWQTPAGGAIWGVAAIAAACLFWGIDNNLTRKLSGRDPVQIAMIKGLTAGAVNLLFALTRGAAAPPVGTLLSIGLLGLLGYGLSLVWFVKALAELGTARTAAYFSTAPFAGALIGVALFGELVSWPLLASAALMAFGLYLHLSEQHQHDHEHGVLEHEHLHQHDLHHTHAHDGNSSDVAPHSHAHQHGPLRHRHHHYPDLHHRHPH